MQSNLQEETVEPVERDTRKGSKWSLYKWIVAAVVLLDQVTKVIAQRTLPLYEPVPVLGDFFRLTYIFNPGAAFGLNVGAYSRAVFLSLSVVAVIFLWLLYRATPPSDRFRLAAVATVTAGAVGNLIDRVRSPRGVIDFLDFGLESVRWPVFNVADMAVTIGAVVLAVSLWREEDPAAYRQEHGAG
ncbi:MAG: signal peptidase II [Longimicrobiaceae bacterium]